MLGPDAAHAGNVVGRVALYGLDVGHRLRSQAAVALPHRRLVVGALRPPAGGGQRDPHVRRHELEQVAVTRQDNRLYLLRFGLPAQRSEHVVGLVARLLEDWDAERAHELAHAVELGPQLWRRGRPVGLVLFVLGVPKRGSGQVEGDGAVGGLPVLPSAEQHVEEAEDRGDFLSRAADVQRLAEGVEGAMDQGVAVDEHEQGGLFEHGRGVGRHGMFSGWLPWVPAPVLTVTSFAGLTAGERLALGRWWDYTRGGGWAHGGRGVLREHHSVTPGRPSTRFE